jgi:hypothetical protein
MEANAQQDLGGLLFMFLAQALAAKVRGFGQHFR